ncbi:MAG: FadR family transcriptional regulator [Desulfatibacillum sp.]|nr:FadR family transcriptional regulator [Desulfatibacillum sp.]
MRQLSRDIFTRRLHPGDKLPSERQLSLDMEIDRTSLRVALKHLESMGVLDIRQGDGIYVRDFTHHAGPEFLQLVVEMDDLDSADTVVDDYLMDEMWEFWGAYFPVLLKMSSKKASSRDMRDLMALLDQELECADDRDAVVELDLLAEERIARATGNMVIMLYSNASRTIRRRMVKAFYDRVDDETVRRHVEIKRALTKEWLSGSMTAEEIADNYGQVLAAHRQAIKQNWESKKDTAALLQQYKEAVGGAGSAKI